MNYGHFSEDGREYIITNAATPTPWINYIYNGRYFATVSNNGGGVGSIRRWVIGPVMGSFHRVITLLNTGRWETPDPFMSLVDSIRGRTRVQNLPGSFVFDVSVTWENPKIAAKIAKHLESGGMMQAGAK